MLAKGVLGSHWLLLFEVIHEILRSHRLKNRWFESNLRWLLGRLQLSNEIPQICLVWHQISNFGILTPEKPSYVGWWDAQIWNWSGNNSKPLNCCRISFKFVHIWNLMSFFIHIFLRLEHYVLTFSLDVKPCNKKESWIDRILNPLPTTMTLDFQVQISWELYIRNGPVVRLSWNARDSHP